MGFGLCAAALSGKRRRRLNYREIVLLEDAQNGLLQFPQGFLSCYNIHLKRVFLAGCVMGGTLLSEKAFSELVVLDVFLYSTGCL